MYYFTTITLSYLHSSNAIAMLTLRGLGLDRSQATLWHHAKLFFYLENTGVAWQCGLSHNFTALHCECSMSVLYKIKTFHVAPICMKALHVLSCSAVRKYITRRPAKRLKCITRSVSHAVCCMLTRWNYCSTFDKQKLLFS